MLVHKKVIKEEDAPCRIPSEFPVLLTKPGGELNSLALKQRSPTAPVLAALLGAAAGG